jgi:hypothetical protein
MEKRSFIRSYNKFCGVECMRLLDKLVSQINDEDILYLLNNEVTESKLLDYKLQIPEDTKELCADITAFANTDGGVIVYGIEEKKENGKNILPSEELY